MNLKETAIKGYMINWYQDRPHESRLQDKWRFTYNDELLFYFGYCVNFYRLYQYNTEPPD